jgi:trk system potassium uptake protein TrkA
VLPKTIAPIKEEDTKINMKIVILGCGRVGSSFARLMYRDGHQVTIIDLQSEAFRRLGTRYKGARIVGNGIDEDILRRAGIEGADVFFAATQGDNRNIMAAQIAKHVFNVPRAVARIYDPIRADRYRQLGLTTLCTTTIAAGLMRDLVTTGEWGLAKDYSQEYLDLDV